MCEASFIVLPKIRDAFAPVLLVLLQKKHGPIVLCALVLEVEAVACSLGSEKRNILGVEAAQEQLPSGKKCTSKPLHVSK